MPQAKSAIRRLADGVQVAPVEVPLTPALSHQGRGGFYFGDGEAGEEGGGGWKGVERGQVLAVGDEALEDTAGEVVVVVDAVGGDLQDVKTDEPEDLGSFLGGQFGDDGTGDIENVQVVDLEDTVPSLQDFELWVIHSSAADLLQGFDAVASGEAFVEEHGVGDDGAGHSTRLRERRTCSGVWRWPG